RDAAVATRVGGSTIESIHMDGCVVSWDAATGRVREILLEGEPIQGALFLPGDRVLLQHPRSLVLRVLGEREPLWARPFTAVGSPQLLPDGRHVAFVCPAHWRVAGGAGAVVALDDGAIVPRSFG